MKKTLMILGVVLVFAILGILGTFALFAKLAETEFVRGEEVYLRDVYVVIDQTLSMRQGQRVEAKDLLKTEVLKSLGVGDRVSCYRISSNFTETTDRVFRSSRQLPKIFRNITAVAPTELPAPEKAELNHRWQQFSQERNSWEDRLDNLDTPRGNYSDYLGTVTEISKRINNASDPNLATEKWLVVIGDLKHEPILKQAPSPKGSQKRSFSDVNVFMVYPGGIHPKTEQERIEKFWRQYFTVRGCRQVSFSSYDGFTGIFPTSPVPQLALPGFATN